VPQSPLGLLGVLVFRFVVKKQCYLKSDFRWLFPPGGEQNCDRSKGRLLPTSQHEASEIQSCGGFAESVLGNPSSPGSSNPHINMTKIRLTRGYLPVENLGEGRLALRILGGNEVVSHRGHPLIN